MKRSSKIGIVAIFLVMLVVGSIFYFEPDFFSRFANIQQGNILAVSSVNIAPQGYEGADSEWKGSYWTVLATTDMEESYNAIKFDSSTVEGHDTINGETIDPSATLEIRVIPGQPYYERPLDKKTYNVYPETKSCVVPKANMKTHSTSDIAVAGRLDASVYVWGEQNWEIHTPFTVQLYKNNELVAEQSVDSVGAPQQVTLRNKNNNAEWVTINDIGKLGTGYEIAVPDIMLFDSSNIFRYSNDLLSDLKYDGSSTCYSNYWFGGGQYGFNTYPGSTGGTIQKASDGSPGGFKSYAGVYPNYGTFYSPIADGQRPGWYRSDGELNYLAKPRAGDVFTTRSGYGQGGYSLVEFLGSVRGHSKVSTLDVWSRGFSLNNNIAKINLPKRSTNSLVTLQISTELADAIVYSPSTGNIEIEDLSWQGSGQVGDRDRLLIKLKQTADIEGTSSATVTITDLNNNPLNMNPSSFGVTLAKGETVTEVSELLNTGANQLVTGKLRVTCSNVYGESYIEEIEYTLLPKGVGSTVLTVHAINAETKQPIAGLAIAVSYSNVYVTKVTGTGGNTNGAFTIDLEGYQGSVSLSSAETTEYKAHSMTQPISVGPNDAFFEVEPLGYVPPSTINWLLIGLVIGMVALIIVIVVAAVYFKKKRRRR